MSVNNIATDISWVLCFHDLPTLFPDAVDGLVSGYFARLQTLGGAPDVNEADFKEQLALGHLGSLGKAIIGAGGLDEDNPKAARLMHKLNCGVLHNMESADTYAAWAKFRSGMLICQNK